MRYTTVIDVTEIPDIWRNPNVTRLYFYMAMRCGYHDEDRDQLRISIRNLSYSSGLTLSACRHALKVLQKFGLVSPMGEYYLVKKFLLEQKISSRAKSIKQQQDDFIAADREQQQQALDRRLAEERRSRNRSQEQLDAEFLQQYQEYLKEPNSAMRKAFLKQGAERYQKLISKNGN